MSDAAADTFLSPNVNKRRTTQTKPRNTMDGTPNPFFPDASTSVEREERDPSESVGRPINIFSDRFDPKSPQSNITSPLQAVHDSPAVTLSGAGESKETDRRAIQTPDNEVNIIISLDDLERVLCFSSYQIPNVAVETNDSSPTPPLPFPYLTFVIFPAVFFSLNRAWMPQNRAQMRLQAQILRLRLTRIWESCIEAF